MAKITHVISYFQPEYGYEETHNINAMVDLGHSVNVICSKYYNPRLYGFKRIEVKNDKDKTKSRVHRENTYELKNFCQNIPRLSKNAKEILLNSEIIFFHNHNSLFNILIILWLKLKFVNVKLIIDVHQNAEVFKKNYFLKFLDFILIMFSKYIANLIIFWNKRPVDVNYLKKGNMIKGSLVVNHNLFNDTKLQDTKLQDTKFEKIRIGITGRINKAKKIDKVLNMLGQFNYKIEFILIGKIDKDLLEELNLLKKKFNLDLKFLGMLEYNDYIEALKTLDFTLFYHHASIGVIESALLGAKPILGPNSQKYYNSNNKDIFINVANYDQLSEFLKKESNVFFDKNLLKKKNFDKNLLKFCNPKLFTSYILDQLNT